MSLLFAAAAVVQYLGRYPVAGVILKIDTSIGDLIVIAAVTLV